MSTTGTRRKQAEFLKGEERKGERKEVGGSGRKVERRQEVTGRKQGKRDLGFTSTESPHILS